MIDYTKSVPVIIEKPGYYTYRTIEELNDQTRMGTVTAAMTTDKNTRPQQVKVLSVTDRPPAAGVSVAAVGPGLYGLATGLACSSGGGACAVALASSPPAGRGLSRARIRGTLELDEFYVTEPLLEQLQGRPEYEVVRGIAAMPVDDQGNLFWK